MSMNICIQALPGGKRKGKREFPSIQTPTDTTLSILAASDPLEAYREWIRSLPWEKDLVDTHLDSLKVFLDQHQTPMYEIEVSMI